VPTKNPVSTWVTVSEEVAWSSWGELLGDELGATIVIENGTPTIVAMPSPRTASVDRAAAASPVKTRSTHVSQRGVPRR
jgi:hypothetical protein